MNILVSKNNFVLVNLLVVISILCIWFDENISSHLSLYFCLLLSISNLYRYAARFFVFLIFFFLFTFPFDFAITLASDVPLIYVYKEQHIYFIFFILNLFHSFAFLCSKPTTPFRYREIEFLNDKLVLIAGLIMLFLGICLMKGDNIFTSDKAYSTYQQNLANASGLNEYLLVFSIFLLFFKKRKITRIMFVVILFFYTLKSISFGFRVQSIMSLLIIGVAIGKKDPPKMITISIAISGFMAMLVFGFLKEGEDISKIGLKIFVDDRYGYAQSHQHGVLSSSTVILEYLDKTDTVKNIFALPASVLASTLPRRFIGDSIPWVYPSTYVQQFEYTPGGGLFLIQIYFLLGSAGVVLFCTIFYSCIFVFCRSQVVTSLKQKLSLIIIIPLFVFFPRWISYDFFNYGLRSIFLIFVLIVFFKCLKILLDKENDET